MPNFLLGPFERGIDTSILTVQGFTPDAGGTLLPDTSGGALRLYSTVESVRIRLANRLVNLSPMTRRQENNVPVETGTTKNFNGLILRGLVNPARKMAKGFDYVLVIWKEGTVTWSFMGVIENYEQDVSKDASRYTLSVRHVDDYSVVDGNGNPIGNQVSNPSLVGDVAGIL